MKLYSIRPVLWVDDVEASINYYVNILQFTCSHFNKEWKWGFVVKDEVEIMFAKPNGHTPYNGAAFTGSLYLNTDNADAWWELLKDKANVFYPIENFEYNMREFAIRDFNGYILQFGQEIG